MTLATNSGANLGHLPLVDVQGVRNLTVGEPRSTELAKGDERAVLGHGNHARWTGNATVLDLAVSESRQIEHFLGWGNSSGHPLYVRAGAAFTGSWVQVDAATNFHDVAIPL